MIWYWIFRHQHTIVTHGSRLDLLAYYCMRLIDIWSIPEMGAAAILARFARHRSPGQVPNATTPPPHIQDHIHSHARSEISLCWMYSEIRNVGRDLLLRSMYAERDSLWRREKHTSRACFIFAHENGRHSKSSSQSPISSQALTSSAAAQLYTARSYTYTQPQYLHCTMGHVPKHALKLTHC